MGYCKLQIIGNLGGDCRVNIVNGKQVINVNVCYTEKWKDAAGVTKEKSLWIDAAYWSESSAIAQYLKKGQQVMIEGIPDVRTYENSQRQTVAQLTMRVNQLVLLGSSKKEDTNTQPSQSNGSRVADDINSAASEEMPF